MQFSAPITALLGMFFLASSAVATPMSGELDVRQAPNGYCNAQNPIAKYPEGGSCSGNGYACSLNCVDIIQCANGVFVKIASCGGATCGGNHNNGAVCY